MSREESTIYDVYNELELHSFALRAFGALLKSSDLWSFADEDLAGRLKSDDFEASNLRAGLQQIIELYLARQEKILNEGIESVCEGDGWLIVRTRTIISMEKEGSFISKKGAINELRVAIIFMDIVINRDGNGSKKDIAVKLKEECLKKIETLQGKKSEAA
ncbi:MAG: hypothetical protein SCARUB_04083 [Candidatus Scalindua rubra]|uniref:Uncharacterized protein n=1 Tax=Candidatus Scalindua rubra TaxID=1872076 RepID=A0A1E3X5F6_9BACT|nr:MAG: hypothetical protein SCARUB_04083 [Candidatus Scalindua rubra]